MSNTQSKLYNLNGTLESAPEFKTNSNGTPYALAKVQSKDKEGKEKSTTVMTYVKNGIEALQGKKAGDSVRLFGTYEKGDKGQTFSAMGKSQEKTADGPAL
jgi:hypothetical protein